MSEKTSLRKIFGGLLPEPKGYGIIKALEILAKNMMKEGADIIMFAAGLPDHARPQEITEKLHEYADEKHAPYSRYPVDEDSISEEKILKDAAEYHRLVTGIDASPERFALTEGSTPAINNLIRTLAIEKAKRDKTPLGEGCVLETFELSYPLYETPANHVAMEVCHCIKINTELDIQDGQPIQVKPWQLDRESVKDSFEKNKDKIGVFAFSNPANPTGYCLSNEEMDFLAEESLKDFLYKKEKGLAPKLIIEDIAYITMMHDDDFKPHTMRHAADKMIAAEEAKGDLADKERLQSLKEFRETIVTVHSLSKAAGAAGDRIAYIEGNEEIVSHLRTMYTDDMLSYANASLYAALGAFMAGKPDRTVMKEYSVRNQTLENGVNKAYYEAVSEAGIEMSYDHIKGTIPFPAKSSGSFFTVMNLKPLVGEKVSEEFVGRVKDAISKIPDEGIRNSFGKVFENNTINEKDLPLYMMFKTHEIAGVGVSSVPLKDGMVRFSTGRTVEFQVERAVDAIKQFFMEDEIYLNAVKNYKDKLPPAPSGKLVEMYSVDAVGAAHTVRAAS